MRGRTRDSRQPVIHSTSARFTASGRSMVERCPQSANGDEPRSGDAGRDLLRERRRGELIAIADQHQGRTFDRGQAGPCIRPRHDRLLLAQEGLRAGLLGHDAHALASASSPLPVAMDEYRKLQRRHLGESAGLGKRDLRLAPRGLLRRFGPRRGIEQRELGDALGRVPHDGQGEVAAHGKPGERKARRRGGEDAARDRVHAVVAGMVGNRTGPNRHSAGICSA